jgi:sn-glycerol 3-phosphate transport system substrate-binding protein
MSVQLFNGQVSVDEGLSEMKSTVEEELDRYYS